MGGYADRRAFYHGIKFHYDFERVRAVFSSVYVHSDCADSAVNICGRDEPERREKFYQVLCGGVPGGGGRGTGVHYFFPVCHVPARGQCGGVGGHDGMELCGRVNFQHACPCGGGQNVRQSGQGNDGIVG